MTDYFSQTQEATRDPLAPAEAWVSAYLEARWAV